MPSASQGQSFRAAAKTVIASSSTTYAVLPDDEQEEKPALKPVTPPPPTYPQCSSSEKDLRAMSNDILGRDVIGSAAQSKTWYEDVPLVGGHSRLRLYAVDGAITVEMFNGDGQSVGVSRLSACAHNGSIRTKMSTAGLSLGGFARAQLTACTGSDAQIQFDLRKDPSGKIRISDVMGRQCSHSIDSTFSLLQNGSAGR